MSTLLQGRLCARATGSGTALVGVLSLPTDALVDETHCFVLVHNPDTGLSVQSLPEPQSRPLDDEEKSYGMSHLMTRPVWPRPVAANAIPIRFIEAFPETNTWAFFGVTPFELPEWPVVKASDIDTDHVWLDVIDGTVSAIAPPFKASGRAMGQILDEPVWPNAEGVPHGLPNLQAPWREAMHAYHLKLVAGHREGRAKEALQEMREDPSLAPIVSMSLDPLYLDSLTALSDAGHLHVETPRTVQAHAKRATISKQAMLQALGEDATLDEDPSPALPRGPRP